MPPNFLEIDHPWVSHEHLPVYMWSFPAEALDEELTAFARAREEWAQRAQYPVAWVVELSNLTMAGSRQRAMFTAHLRRFESHDIRWNAGSALVVPNAWLRGLVTSVFWVASPKFPHKTFPHRALALQWAREQLEAWQVEG